jgi:cytochrome c-type biogenesis protein CcmE
MKKLHLIIILLLAAGIGVIMSTLADSSTYATFASAAAAPAEEFHVVGKLAPGKAMEYNPEVDANLFSFYMVDKDQNIRKVVFSGTKPQDFERSEQIVVTGKCSGDNFHASKILMKCPSKYNNGQTVEINAEAGKQG